MKKKTEQIKNDQTTNNQQPVPVPVQQSQQQHMFKTCMINKRMAAQSSAAGAQVPEETKSAKNPV